MTRRKYDEENDSEEKIRRGENTIYRFQSLSIFRLQIVFILVYVSEKICIISINFHKFP